MNTRKIKNILFNKTYHFRAMRKKLMADILSAIFAGLIVAGVTMAILPII